MGLLNEYTTVALNSGVISHYEKLGYTIPRVTKNYKTMVERGTTIQVKTTDLPKGSNVYVDVECDCCKSKYHMTYHKYTQNIDNHNGVYLCAIDNKHRQFIGELPTFDELIEQIKSFYRKHNGFPKYNEYKTNNGFTASYSQMMWILNDNNTTLLDELSKIDCFKSRPNIKYYGKYLKRLKEVVENGTLPSLSHLSQDNYCEELGLPNIRWLVDNCPNDNIKCIDDLREYAGLYRSVLSKEECTQQIYEIGNDVIYIEIAGIIECYKEWFYQDRPITRSKSKEKYRLKLKNKENMLTEHGLKYYILFPCDLTKDNFKAIITNPNLDLKKNIESFIKNNIDWCRVREIGELKYTDNIAYGRRQIDYGEAI